jgi:hypothetical protein
MDHHRVATTKSSLLRRCLEATNFVSCHCLHHHLRQWVKCSKRRLTNISSLDRVAVRCLILLAMLVVHLPWLLCLAPIILKPIFLRAGMHPKHITSMFLLSIAWLSLLVLRPLLQLGVINSYLQPDQFSHQWGRKEDRVQWPTASLWRK